MRGPLSQIGDTPEARERLADVSRRWDALVSWWESDPERRGLAFAEPQIQRWRRVKNGAETYANAFEEAADDLDVLEEYARAAGFIAPPPSSTPSCGCAEITQPDEAARLAIAGGLVGGLFGAGVLVGVPLLLTLAAVAVHAARPPRPRPPQPIHPRLVIR